MFGPTLETVFLTAGGLGLFLFGMKMMSSGIEMAAGEKLQNMLQKATRNRVMAVIVGILATIAINSSTATTIMTVSFVHSGLLNLFQAMGIILGANVGTTFSAQLIAFRIDTIAPLFIFVGILLHLFARRRKYKNIGYIILGFGVLFFGISVMSGPLRELARQPEFYAILKTFENPFLALMAGFIFTAVIQSSSATMALLVTMHFTLVPGEPPPMSFQTAAFIILGTNIGTSITTIIASIPASRESKRAALFHIMFDVIGSTIFGTLVYLGLTMPLVPDVLAWFEGTWEDPARRVAMFHMLYNFATMFLILPFLKPVAVLMEKMMPIKEADKPDTKYEKKLMYLDTDLVEIPSVVIRNAHLELCRIQEIANEMLGFAIDAFVESDVDKAKKVDAKTVRYLTRKTSSKLVKLNRMTMIKRDAKKVGKMFRTLYDLERIAAHAENITEYVVQIKENDLNFPDDAIKELKELGSLTTKLADLSLSAFKDEDASMLPQIEELENQVDKFSKELTENQINRMKEETLDPRAGVIFTDMIIDLERSADHSNIIASNMLEQKQSEKK
ncbi:MAG: Na/Pi cotransporter family protein [Bacteroidales bacterium]|nr:Na/Pi cotransporter family protein [Bacteroidales bacterium]